MHYAIPRLSCVTLAMFMIDFQRNSDHSDHCGVLRCSSINNQVSAYFINRLTKGNVKEWNSTQEEGFCSNSVWKRKLHAIIIYTQTQVSDSDCQIMKMICYHVTFVDRLTSEFGSDLSDTSLVKNDHWNIKVFVLFLVVHLATYSVIFEWYATRSSEINTMNKFQVTGSSRRWQLKCSACFAPGIAVACPCPRAPHRPRPRWHFTFIVGPLSQQKHFGCKGLRMVVEVGAPFRHRPLVRTSARQPWVVALGLWPEELRKSRRANVDYAICHY